MLKSRTIPIFVLLLIAAVGINYLLQPPPVKLQPFLPGVIDKRSWLETNCRGVGRDVEKCQATIAALEGSGAAALRLVSGIPPDDVEGKHFWLNIAAQNGNPEAMRRLAQALVELPDELYGRVHRIRAHFWIERAAKAGDTEAVTLRLQIPPVSEAEAAEHRIQNDSNPNPELLCSPVPWWRFFAVLWGDVDPRLSIMKGRAYLACRDILRLEDGALRGENESGSGAEDLGLFMTVTEQRQNDDYALYWDVMGAENGSTTSKYNIGVFEASAEALPNINPDSRIRGFYWLRQAADDGNKYAVMALKARFTNIDLATEWLNEEP